MIVLWNILCQDFNDQNKKILCTLKVSDYPPDNNLYSLFYTKTRDCFKDQFC